jgi:hypothetical protein
MFTARFARVADGAEVTTEVSFVFIVFSPEKNGENTIGNPYGIHMPFFSTR